MASSSVSQDDVDNDFEKNSRRSRIRTARARQINPSSNSCSAQTRLELDDGNGGDLLHHADQQTGNDFAADTSPKPVGRNSVKDTKRNLPNKLPQHHVNKGKQQRDRRKLREKRRSTGVVHLASTESTTGGSTTGDDGESSDVPTAKPAADSANPSSNSAGIIPSGSCGIGDQTKRNTQLNEALSYNHHYHQSASSNSNAGGGSKTHHRSNSTSSNSTVLYPTSIMRNSAGLMRNHRHKSHSDLEADDENDHDSLNQSDASSAFSSSNHLPGLTSSSSHAGREEEGASKVGGSNSCSTPIVRPATPTGDSYPEQIERVVEENKRLLSLMEEKDRKIHLLEYQIQQLMKDTSSKSEEQSRLQRENSTLLRALANITAAKKESS